MKTEHIIYIFLASHHAYCIFTYLRHVYFAFNEKQFLTMLKSFNDKKKGIVSIKK